MITKTFDRPIYQSPSRTPRFRLPFRLKGRSLLVSLLIWFTAPLMMLFLLVARDGAMVVGAATSFPNPFTAHYTLMPGQMAQAVEGATCDEGSPREPNKVCAVYPEEGLFHLISYTERQGGIVETSFYSESLQLGSLLQEWGEPDATRRNAGGRTFTLVWDSPMSSASATLIPNGHEGYVRIVTITTDIR
jgi:hypothetical protein